MDTNSNQPEINVGRLYIFLGHVLRLYLFTNSTQFGERPADRIREKMETDWVHLSQAERDIATGLSAALDMPANT